MQLFERLTGWSASNREVYNLNQYGIEYRDNRLSEFPWLFFMNNPGPYCYRWIQSNENSTLIFSR